jgi:hypothetical protein
MGICVQVLFPHFWEGFSMLAARGAVKAENYDQRRGVES